jgi:hypothetical protein
MLQASPERKQVAPRDTRSPWPGPGARAYTPADTRLTRPVAAPDPSGQPPREHVAITIRDEARFLQREC